MLSKVNFNILYSSGEHDPSDFFIDALLNSKTFDLGLGYFHSSGFKTLALGFAFFLANGGKLRIIINNTLTQNDQQAILEGSAVLNEREIEKYFIEHFEYIHQSLSREDQHFYKCLSWLIAEKRIEFLACIPEEGRKGIVHHKFGIFQDEAGNQLGFTGSANFSQAALIHNIETLSCFWSWGEASQQQAVGQLIQRFREIWEGKATSIKTIPLEKIQACILEYFPERNLNSLVEESSEMLNAYHKLNRIDQNTRQKIEELQKKHNLHSLEPRFPFPSGPRDYQQEALQAWETNEYIGFFEMATGTGKTITALNCVLSLYRKSGAVHVVVLVPTIQLASQWEAEIRQFHFKNIVLATSKQSAWPSECLRLINRSLFNPVSFFFITTYETFVSPKFQSIISRLEQNSILIADEAHHFGTQRQIQHHPEKLQRRIGLSATPARYFDEDGTQSLLSFFHASDKPTFSLNLSEAIEQGFLCKYFYYPRLVLLTDEEMEAYISISKKLMKYFHADQGSLSDNDAMKKLLLQRKRIIQKAERKLECLREIITELQGSYDPLQYTLLYVPEGTSNGSESDVRLIDEYSDAIEAFGLRTQQFTGETQNRDQVLRTFSLGKTQVLTAMKCLDEGIDVKRTEIAIFGASTSNPKQFIQRRGRVLRTHPNKKFAYIYDMVVMPPFLSAETEKFDRYLLASELKRVYEFASSALNKYEAVSTLEEMGMRLGIDVYNF